MASIYYLGISLVLLILLSAFFSGSETGMMALNRYRLRFLARKGDVTAKRVARLLERPDRLLGVILIGNTFANVLASAIATVIAVHYFGDIGVIFATIILTLVILIFAETTPKTLAALHPQQVAFPASWLLKLLLKLFYPLVWLVNGIANGVLALFHIKMGRKSDALSAEELRSVVLEATGKISSNYQDMLLRILDLEQVTIADIMIPRNEIDGIDLSASWDTILQQIRDSEHAYLPVYRDNIDQVIGILNLRKLLLLLNQTELTKSNLVKYANEVYFIPEVTLLNQQLLRFQEQRKSIGLVVDEYGDIQGLVTLQDILEEIVGEFAVGDVTATRLVRKQKDGSYLIDAAINLRDLNRITGWNLPTDGPNTLSGLMIEYLEMIPISDVSLRVAGYPMEVLRVHNNKIRLVQVWPSLWRTEELEDD